MLFTEKMEINIVRVIFMRSYTGIYKTDILLKLKTMLKLVQSKKIQSNLWEFAAPIIPIILHVIPWISNVKDVLSIMYIFAFVLRFTMI